MLPAPKLLLFDLDDVLVDYRHDVRCQVIAGATGLSPQAVHEGLFDSGLEALCDAGEIDLHEYLDALRTDFGWTLPEEIFVQARSEATQVRPEMLQLCQQLGDHTAVAVFTNNGHWVFEHLERIAPELRRVFGRRFVASGSVRARKPAPEAFAACLARLGFSPLSTLFVDDKEANVLGAREAGLDAVQYLDHDTLRADLRRRGFESL
jgi:putative hydrolase of the HAD superfamily